MARPPLPLGTPGTISVVEEEPGSWVARCRFRDHDGVTRRLRKHGPSKTAAKAARHELIQQRQRGKTGRGAVLTPASRFREAAVLYLAKVDRKREDSTHALYAYHLERTRPPWRLAGKGQRAEDLSGRARRTTGSARRAVDPARPDDVLRALAGEGQADQASGSERDYAAVGGSVKVLGHAALSRWQQTVRAS